MMRQGRLAAAGGVCAAHLVMRQEARWGVWFGGERQRWLAAIKLERAAPRPIQVQGRLSRGRDQLAILGADTLARLAYLLGHLHRRPPIRASLSRLCMGAMGGGRGGCGCCCCCCTDAGRSAAAWPEPKMGSILAACTSARPKIINKRGRLFLLAAAT